MVIALRLSWQAQFPINTHLQKLKANHLGEIFDRLGRWTEDGVEDIEGPIVVTLGTKVHTTNTFLLALAFV